MEDVIEALSNLKMLVGNDSDIDTNERRTIEQIYDTVGINRVMLQCWMQS